MRSIALSLNSFWDAHPSQVLSHLHPLDLLTLARMHKVFRAFLMSRNAAWLWGLAFTRHPDIPACPSDIPHPWWTDLLFGPLVCQVTIFRPWISSVCPNVVLGLQWQDRTSILEVQTAGMPRGML